MTASTSTSPNPVPAASARPPLSELFSARNVAEMSWYGRTATATATAEALRRDGLLRDGHTYRELFEAAFDAMWATHRSEYVYKSLLVRRLVFGMHSPRTTALLLEFRVDETRADAVLVNGAATAYEFKSEFDDLDRAVAQVDGYSRCFRFLTFVVEDGLVERALRDLPAHVGVLRLTARRHLSKVRPVQAQTDRLDSRSIFRRFRQAEYESILGARGLCVRSVPLIERHLVAEERFATIPSIEANLLLEHALRRRAPATKAAKLCERLPASLHAAAFGYRMRQSDWNTLADRLDVAF